MYDIVKSIIGHTWQTGSNVPGDQQYIYYIVSVVIVVLLVLLFDSFMTFFRSLTMSNRK